MSQLQAPKAPALPNPTAAYEASLQSQVNLMLRSYFNQIDTSMQQLLLGFNHHGTFRRDATQTRAAGTNLVPWDATGEAYGIRVNTPTTTEILVSRAGMYKFQYTLQLRHNAASAATFHVWPLVNGVAVPNSAFRYVIQNPAHDMLATRDYLVTLKAGDRFSLGWSSTETTATLQATPAAPPVPAVPAATLTVYYLFPNGAV